VLDPVAAAGIGAFGARRAAGLPVTPRCVAAVALAMHGAVPHLLAGGRESLAAVGRTDRDGFVRDLLAAVHPEEP
jgi:hypothetical protein